MTTCLGVSVSQVVSTRLTEHSSKRQRLLKTTLKQSQLRDATGRNQVCCMRAMQRAPVAQKHKYSFLHIMLIHNIHQHTNSIKFPFISIYRLQISFSSVKSVSQLCPPVQPRRWSDCLEQPQADTMGKDPPQQNTKPHYHNRIIPSLPVGHRWLCKVNAE